MRTLEDVAKRHGEDSERYFKPRLERDLINLIGAVNMMSKQLTLLCEAKDVTVPPIPEAEKPHNTSKHPQKQTSPTDVASAHPILLYPLLPITNKKRI